LVCVAPPSGAGECSAGSLRGKLENDENVRESEAVQAPMNPLSAETTS